MKLDNSVKGVKVKRNNIVSEVAGVRVKKNGVITTAWVAATPYTVDFMDYPITQDSWDGYSTVKTCNTTESGYEVSVMKNSGVTAYGVLSASVALLTQGCNKVKVKYTASHYETHSAGSINDNEVISGVGNELILDCTGDEFTLTLSVVDATGYHTAKITVTEVSFYNESI